MDIRSQIISVAKDFIQKNGVDSFSFRTIADEINIKSASVHYHFPKKEDLIVEIAKGYNLVFMNVLSNIKNSDITPKKKLLSLLKLFEDTKKSNKVCLSAMLATTTGKLDKNSNHELNYFFKMLSDWVIDILKIAKKNKQLNPMMPTKSLANLVVASFEGALLIDRVDDDYKYLKSCRDLVNTILT